MLRAVCPNNPMHTMFVTVAHVAEDWVVDPHGRLLKSLDAPHDVVATPDRGNTWTCRLCDAEALVFDCDPETPIGQCPNCRKYGVVEEGCPTCPGFWFMTPAGVGAYVAAKENEGLSVDQVIDEIREVLCQAEGEFVQDIANRVLSKQVTYKEDGFFTCTERCD